MSFVLLCASRQDHLHLLLKNLQEKKCHNIPSCLLFCSIYLRRPFRIPNVNFVWSCLTNYFPYPPISPHGVGEQITDFLFHRSFVFLQPVAMFSLRHLFFRPSTPNSVSISCQVTFPHSLTTLIAFPLDFLQTLCILFGVCCPNPCIEV